MKRSTLQLFLIWASTIPPSSSAFNPSVNSHASLSPSSSTSASRSTFDQTPLLTLTSIADGEDSTPYLCQPQSQCLPCSPHEIEESSPVCSIWGNKRKLICQPYRDKVRGSLNPSPVEDPDSQQQNSGKPRPPYEDGEGGGGGGPVTLTTSTPSQYYEFDPSSDAKDGSNAGKDGGDEEEDAGTIGESGYESSDELDNVQNAGRLDERSTGEAFLGPRGLYETWRKRSSAREGPPVIRYMREKVERDVYGGGGGGRLEVYEACPRVVKREQSDYFEFVLCNLFFALAGLTVLMYRQRTLAGRQFGKLVARIMQTEIR